MRGEKRKKKRRTLLERKSRATVRSQHSPFLISLSGDADQEMRGADTAVPNPLVPLLTDTQLSRAFR